MYIFCAAAQRIRKIFAFFRFLFSVQHHSRVFAAAALRRAFAKFSRFWTLSFLFRMLCASSPQRRFAAHSQNLRAFSCSLLPLACFARLRCCGDSLRIRKIFAFFAFCFPFCMQRASSPQRRFAAHSQNLRVFWVLHCGEFAELAQKHK